MIRRTILFAALLAVAPTASATRFAVIDRLPTRELPIFIGGSFQLENIDGDIDVIGTDEAKVSVTAVKSIRGVDDDALKEGLQMTQPVFTGNDRQLIVRTWISPMKTDRWSSSVNYVVKVPRTVHTTIFSRTSSRIRVADMTGHVRVKNVNGGILLERLTGAAIIVSANGNIVFHAPQQVGATVRLTSINGTVEVHAPQNSAFRWVAEAVRGEIRSTFPVQGDFTGTTFNGVVNTPGRGTLFTKTLLGNVTLVRSGAKVAEAQLIRRNTPPPAPPGQLRPPQGRNLNQPMVPGSVRYATSMGDVTIGEVRGAANISTGAGSVQLGAVRGECDVRSGGGPLSLGTIFGPLTAHTQAGDVIVQSAREGGRIVTGGGIIRLLASGGPMVLESGGGDIVVRQASAPVSAETRSGDITLTLDPGSRSQRIALKTAKGNLLLNVSPGFGADIDATILTMDADANAIRSDFQGLTVQRDQVGSKTRIRATGKINGGGERVELFAENGGIQIVSQAPATAVATVPR